MAPQSKLFSLIFLAIQVYQLDQMQVDCSPNRMKHTKDQQCLVMQDQMGQLS